MVDDEVVSARKPKFRILRLLSEESRHGYEISDELGRHGSTVYEHLHELEDESYIEGEEDGRRIVYHLTEKGELILEAGSMDDCFVRLFFQHRRPTDAACSTVPRGGATTEQ